MARDQAPKNQDPDVGAPCDRELSEAELDGVSAGVGGLVHENVHAGTLTPPRTGGTRQTPSLPASSTRSPPSGMP